MRTCRIAFCVIRWLFVFHGWYRSTWPVLKIILNPFKIHKLINVNAFFYLPCLNIANKITQRKFNSWRKQYKKSSLETKHNVKLITGKVIRWIYTQKNKNMYSQNTWRLSLYDKSFPTNSGAQHLKQLPIVIYYQMYNASHCEHFHKKFFFDFLSQSINYT